jgi:hypothetical protein
MRRMVVPGATLAAAAAATFLVAAPAAAGEPVHIEAATVIEDPAADFTSTLDGCTWGTVENGRLRVAFTPRFGVFNGEKVFSCGETDGGFVVRLQAKFSEDGSTGTWAITRSWGSQAGLHGAGTLVGEPLEPDGILDIYDGMLRP